VGPAARSGYLHAATPPPWARGVRGDDTSPGAGVAVLRSWHDRYGARLHYLGSTALELTVASPPATVAEVAQVAVEQYAYCCDLDQIFGDPLDIAERQVPTRWWYFWWD
jgi:hypothetical protein